MFVGCVRVWVLVALSTHIVLVSFAAVGVLLLLAVVIVLSAVLARHAVPVQRHSLFVRQ